MATPLFIKEFTALNRLRVHVSTCDKDDVPQEVKHYILTKVLTKKTVMTHGIENLHSYCRNTAAYAKTVQNYHT